MNMRSGVALSLLWLLLNSSGDVAGGDALSLQLSDFKGNRSKAIPPQNVSSDLLVLDLPENVTYSLDSPDASAVLVSLDLQLQMPDGFGLDTSNMMIALANALTSLGHTWQISGGHGLAMFNLSAWNLTFVVNVTQNASEIRPSDKNEPPPSVIGVGPCDGPALADLSDMLGRFIPGIHTVNSGCFNVPNATPPVSLPPPLVVSESSTAVPASPQTPLPVEFGSRRALLGSQASVSPPATSKMSATSSRPPPRKAHPPKHPRPPKPPKSPKPIPGHSELCSTSTGRLNVSTEITGYWDPTSAISMMSDLIANYSNTNAGSLLCNTSSQGVYSSASIQVTYAIAVPLSTSSSTASSLCVSIASQTPSTLQTALGNGVGVVSSSQQVGCTVQQVSWRSSPDPSSSGSSSSSSVNPAGSSSQAPSSSWLMPQGSNSSGTGLSLGDIVGIAIGALTSSILVGAALLSVVHHIKKRKQEHMENESSACCCKTAAGAGGMGDASDCAAGSSGCASGPSSGFGDGGLTPGPSGGPWPACKASVSDIGQAESMKFAGVMASSPSSAQQQASAEEPLRRGPRAHPGSFVELVDIRMALAQAGHAGVHVQGPYSGLGRSSGEGSNASMCTASCNENQEGADTAEWATTQNQEGADTAEWATTQNQGGADTAEWVTTQNHGGADTAEWATTQNQEGADTAEWATTQNQGGADTAEWVTTQNHGGADTAEWATTQNQEGADTAEHEDMKVATSGSCSRLLPGRTHSGPSVLAGDRRGGSQPAGTDDMVVDATYHSATGTPSLLKEQSSVLLPEWLSSAVWAESTNLDSAVKSLEPHASSPDSGHFRYTVMTGQSPSPYVDQPRADSALIQPSLNAVKSFEFQKQEQGMGLSAFKLSSAVPPHTSTTLGPMSGRVVSTEVTLKQAAHNPETIIQVQHSQQRLQAVKREGSPESTGMTNSAPPSISCIQVQMGSPSTLALSHHVLCSSTMAPGADLPSVVSIGITVPPAPAAGAPSISNSLVGCSAHHTSGDLSLTPPMTRQPSEPLLSHRFLHPRGQSAGRCSVSSQGVASVAEALTYPPARSSARPVTEQPCNGKRRRHTGSSGAPPTNLSASGCVNPNTNPTDNSLGIHIGWGATLAPEPHTGMASNLKRTFGYSTVVPSGKRSAAPTQHVNGSPFSHGSTITAATLQPAQPAVGVPPWLPITDAAADTRSAAARQLPGARTVETMVYATGAREETVLKTSLGPTNRASSGAVSSPAASGSLMNSSSPMQNSMDSYNTASTPSPSTTPLASLSPASYGQDHCFPSPQRNAQLVESWVISISPSDAPSPNTAESTPIQGTSSTSSTPHVILDGKNNLSDGKNNLSQSAVKPVIQGGVPCSIGARSYVHSNSIKGMVLDPPPAAAVLPLTEKPHNIVPEAPVLDLSTTSPPARPGQRAASPVFSLKAGACAGGTKADALPPSAASLSHDHNTLACLPARHIAVNTPLAALDLTAVPPSAVLDLRGSQPYALMDLSGKPSTVLEDLKGAPLPVVMDLEGGLPKADKDLRGALPPALMDLRGVLPPCPGSFPMSMNMSDNLSMQYHQPSPLHADMEQRLMASPLHADMEQGLLMATSAHEEMELQLSSSPLYADTWGRYFADHFTSNHDAHISKNMLQSPSIHQNRIHQQQHEPRQNHAMRSCYSPADPEGPSAATSLLPLPTVSSYSADAGSPGDLSDLVSELGGSSSPTPGCTVLNLSEEFGEDFEGLLLSPSLTVATGYQKIESRPEQGVLLQGDSPMMMLQGSNNYKNNGPFAVAAGSLQGLSALVPDQMMSANGILEHRVPMKNKEVHGSNEDGGPTSSSLSYCLHQAYSSVNDRGPAAWLKCVRWPDDSSAWDKHDVRGISGEFINNDSTISESALRYCSAEEVLLYKKWVEEEQHSAV
ncbi:hypothetical protein CEUSTIGMA_g10450.t1 [Chlamydomonas eustigma]|uniref:Uncharacterized protein n=1 Tax=Chlamydomonas eustigma TaxID=1157962 RepID=A0A250XJ05_9CHLO|nr:hypothetical protein CEUSTIGMA_g10450.t1 [Chlamydomonas eustigma]|eukprot:GAX83023.1 hypothetical protein CEUSTIGMA_g10450.t1 [Chlamydomonas eustigma]